MLALPEVQLLRRVPLFSLLTEEQLKAIGDGTRRCTVRRGQLIVDPSRPADVLFILLSGQACILVEGSRGREVILATLRPGEHFGEMSLIDDGPRSAAVRAETHCELLTLGREQFAACLPRNNSLSYAILRGLVQRLRGANRQITSLALVDLHGRIARALLDMAEGVDGHRVIAHRVSRDKLAKVVGASREMTSRVMKALERSGAIQTLGDGRLLLNSSLPSAAENGRKALA